MDFSFLGSLAFWAATALAYLIPKISPYIDTLFRNVWLLASTKIPSILKKYVRNGKAKRLREVKSKRWSFSSISYEIAKANSFFLLFCGVSGVYLILLIIGPLNIVLKANFWLGMTLTVPIYFFEVLWLIQDHKAKNIIKSNSKIRITRCSSSFAPLTGTAKTLRVSSAP